VNQPAKALRLEEARKQRISRAYEALRATNRDVLLDCVSAACAIMSNHKLDVAVGADIEAALVVQAARLLT
jgi:myo-inositol catabolism protein IolC